MEIAERARVQEAMRYGEEKCRNILENVEDGVHFTVHGIGASEPTEANVNQPMGDRVFCEPGRGFRFS